MDHPENSLICEEHDNRDQKFSNGRINDILIRTFSGDGIYGWNSGRIAKISASDTDQPYAAGFPLSRKKVIEQIEWMESLIIELDQRLPVEELIESCISYEALIVGDMPAAFRIPERPDPHFAAECLLAARVLIRCIEDVIPPHGASSSEFLVWLNQISCLALLLGGEAAMLMAMAINDHPDTYYGSDGMASCASGVNEQ